MSKKTKNLAYNLASMHEIGKMKVMTEKLRQEIRKNPIDRLSIKEILFDCGTICSTISYYIQITSSDSKDKNMIGKSTETVSKDYAALAIKLLNYAKEIDDIEKYPDVQVRNDIFTTISAFNVEVVNFETYQLSNGNAVSPFSKIMEFITNKPLGLDEKWVAAACHLSAFDILVNKKRKELGIEKKPEDEKKIDFYTRFDALVKELESNSGELSKITKQMPKLFWRIRVDVVHYGYVPSSEELDLIINWSKSIMKIISEESKIG